MQLTVRAVKEQFKYVGWSVANFFLIISGMYLWGSDDEAETIRHARIEITIPNLPPAFDGYRIVNLADIHFGPAMAYSTVMRAVEMTCTLAPDLIVSTGDFISYWVDDANLIRALTPLSAPDGVWAVMGNHDYWEDIDHLRHILDMCGVCELRNTSTRITRGADSIWLAGVDDVVWRKHNLDAALYGIPDAAPVILLAHEPDYADKVAPTRRVSLQLSGHAHGGQVALFNIPILSNFIWLGRKYPRGLYRVGEMMLYTSSGLGRGPLPRYGAPPELTEIILRYAPS
jgi:uncharacterized protein